MTKYLIAGLLSVLFIAVRGTENTPYPRDWIRDFSYRFDASRTLATHSDAKAKALFSCPPAPAGYGHKVTWYQVLLGNVVSKLPTDKHRHRVINESTLVVYDKDLPNVGLFCERTNGHVLWRSRVALMKDLSSQEVKLQQLPCRPPSPIFSCARTESVSLYRDDAHFVVYTYKEDDGAYNYSFMCRSKEDGFTSCHREDGVFVSGPFLFTNRKIAMDVKCIKEWRPFFLSKPLSLTAKGTLKVDNTQVKKLVILVSASSRNLTRIAGGENLRITCISLMGSSLTWRKDGRKLFNTSRVTVSNFDWGSEVFIKDLRSSDIGKYRCSSLLESGELLEGSLPISLIGRRHTPINEGQDLRLRCCHPLIKSDPQMVRWMFNNSELPSHSRVDDCSYLSLRKIKKSDFGTYSCEISMLPKSRFSIIPEEWLSWLPSPPRKYFSFISFIVNNENVREEELNNFAPTFQINQKTDGNNIRVDLNATRGVILTMMVDDEDNDKEGPGRVRKCFISCDASEWENECPEFEVIRRGSVEQWKGAENGGWLFGRVTTRLRGPFSSRRMEIVCQDDGRTPNNGSLVLQVTNCVSCSQPISPVEKTLTNLMLNVSTLKANATETFIDSLENATKKAEDFTPYELQLTLKTTSSLIDNVNATQKEEKKVELVQGVADVISNCMKASKKTMQKVSGSSSDILKSVSKLSEVIPVSLNDSKGRVVPTDNLVIGAVAVNRTSKSDIRFIVKPSGKFNDSLITEDQSLPVLVSVEIDQRQVKDKRIDFSYFPDEQLFNSSISDVNVVSPVIAARANFKEEKSDRPPVRLVFNVSTKADSCSGKRPECSFWNVTTKRWENGGCITSTDSNGVTKCRCSHLTNFALILKLDDTALPKKHQLVLSSLSYIFLPLSVIALILTCYIYFSYLQRRQRRARSGQKSNESAINSSRLHICFCATLLASLTFFLSFAHYKTPGAFCQVIGIVHHYLLLSVFMWSVVEGAHIYSAIIHVAIRTDSFRHEIRKFFLKAALFAWGLPAVIVLLISAITKTGAYGLCESSNQNSESLCFFKVRKFYYYSFLLPLCCCLAVNLIILCLLGYALHYRIGVNAVPKKKQKKSKRKVIGFIGVFVVLNGTWIVGFLNAGVFKIAGSYLFVIVNGLQGCFVFFCYCIFQVEVLNHMRKHILCCRWIPQGEDTTTTGITSTANPYTQRPSIATGDLSIPLIRNQSEAISLN